MPPTPTLSASVPHSTQTISSAAEALAVLLAGPAAFPADGVTFNFDGPNGSAPELYTVLYLCIVLSAIAIFFRTYAKVFLIKQVGWDDYLIIAGWVTFVSYEVICAMAINDGVGKHMWDVRISELKPILLDIYIVRLTYGVPITFCKTSALLQYLAIFNPSVNFPTPPSTLRDAPLNQNYPSATRVTHRGYMFYSCWTTIYITNLFYLALMFTAAFATTPIHKFWTPWMSSGSVNIDFYAVDMISGIVNTIIDVVIILLPQRAIWALHSSMNPAGNGPSVLKASGVFAISLFALVASIRRTAYSLTTMRSGDKTYSLGQEGMWTGIEIAMTIICSCMPAMTTCLTHFEPRVRFRRALASIKGARTSWPPLNWKIRWRDPEKEAGRSERTASQVSRMSQKWWSAGANMSDEARTKKRLSVLARALRQGD